MSRRYSLGPLAIADLKSIAQYVAQDNPPAAKRLRKRFLDRFDLLGSNSLSGEARPDLGPDIRIISVGNYVIVFRPASPGVQIVRLLHGARDIESLFRDQRP
jgi:toxin ParE1/3/4